MSFNAEVLLERLAGQLRQELAPSLDDEYLRTQAYMAAVILERLARQAEHRERHQAAEDADIARLVTELERILPSVSQQTNESVPDDLRDALALVRTAGTVMALRPLVEALYRWSPERPEAVSALAAIRSVLRVDIDRRMEIAR